MKKRLLILATSFILSACGGGSDDSNLKAPDDDGDNIANALDNCPTIVNADQLDSDNNGIGDACEPLSVEQLALNKISQYAKSSGESATPSAVDYANAGFSGLTTEQVSTLNQNIIGLAETDVDSVAEINQIIVNLGIQTPTDPTDPKPVADSDGDGVNDDVDNCINTPNPNQENLDGDDKGDACDSVDNRDTDNDGVNNTIDNCPEIPNPDQLDDNDNGVGNACDEIIINRDRDGDGVDNEKDEFPDDNTRAASINSAQRLLTQATFGATVEEIDRIVRIGTDAWLDEQLNMPSAYDSDTDNHRTHLERTIEIAALVEPNRVWFTSDNIFNEKASNRVANMQMSAWWENALGHKTNTRHGSDQLRQRMAYALSQILVTSGLDATLGNHAESLAYYYDILSKHALGNYRDLLGEVSRSPTMGVYLTFRGNKKTDSSLSVKPDENFARELIQLFVLGLYDLNLDGTANRDKNTTTYPDAGDTLKPSYTQVDVEELAKVMTGWDIKDNVEYGSSNVKKGNYATAMEFNPEYHEDEADIEGGDGFVDILGKKIALNSGADGSGMDEVLDHLFAHPNVAPFISKRLINILVTSNPSSAFVARVSSIFNDNGNGVKGDLRAVAKAILSDPEARSNLSNPHFGKVKEPIVAWSQFLRAFNVTTLDGWLGPNDSTLGRASVNGVYSFPAPEAVFDQAPLRSKSVFNFYDAGFVPSDNYFSKENLISPESQLMTGQNLVDFSNFTLNFIQRAEKNRITKVSSNPKTISEYAQTKTFFSQFSMLIDFDRELRIFEQALDGDSDGDFFNINEPEPRAKAVDALIAHLNKLLLGNRMAAEYRAALREYLIDSRSLNNSDKFKEAHNVVTDAIRYIVTSSAFMIQK